MFLAVAILAVGGWAVLSRWRKPPLPEAARVETNGPPSAPATKSLEGSVASPEISIAVQSLKQSGRPEDSLACLAHLRNQLRGLGTEAASRAVQRFLDSGADAPTHLGFKLARDGSLSAAPSLRLFLLDYLVQVDPKAAAAYAERILNSSNSPDESAISLRAYALANTGSEAKTFLQAKTREVLGNHQWREQPSAGFLETFDVIVYTQDREMTADLANWVQQTNNRALAHAAFLTLDRLIQAEPAEMLARLQTQPDLLEGREAMRADFFSRADVRDARQRQVLEDYLLDPKRSDDELHQFVATYPNANYMVSYNLLTESRTPTGDEIAARDREALRVAEEWLGDSRFAIRRAGLQQIKSRLEQFVGAKAAPE